MVFRGFFALLLTGMGLHAADAITFDMLAESASRHSQKLQLHRYDIQIESARADTVRAEYYPTLSVAFNNEYNKDIDGSSTGVETVGDSLLTSGTRYQSSLSLGLNYELYHFGVTERKVAIADQETALKRTEWCLAEQALHQELLEHYGTALKTQGEMLLQEKIAALQEEAYGQKTRLFEAGKLSKMALGEAAMELLELRQHIASLRQRFNDEIAALSRLGYLELDPEDTVLQPLAEAGEVSQMPAFDDTPAGERLRRSIRQKETELAMQRRSRLPSVAFYSNYYLYGSDPDGLGRSLDDIRRNSWKAGIGVRLNLFDGFRYLSETRRLSLELQRLQEEREMSARDYAYETSTRLRRLDAMAGREPAHREMLQTSDESAVMAERLRQQQEIDAPGHLEQQVRRLQRSLEVEMLRMDARLEAAALKLHTRGSAQCSLR